MLTPHTKGDTYNGLEITYERNGTPIDLTGATIRVMFRLNGITDCPKTKIFTVGDGIVLTDAANGVFTILQNHEINWTAGHWYFDVETNVSGDIKTYYSDVLQIVQDITPST